MSDLHANMEIGTPDEVIITVSLLGFLIIGYSIYLILSFSKTPNIPTHGNIDNHNNGARARGNRAQRRALARQQQEDNHQREINEQDEVVIQEGEVDNNDDVNDNENTEGNANIVMTRKERLKAAKRAEKEERRRMEERRREELLRNKELEEAAYHQRKLKEKEEIEKIQAEETKRKKQIEIQNEKEYDMWKKRFSILGNGNSKYKYDPTVTRSENKEDAKNMTDDPFVTYIKEVKFVTIDDLSTRFLLTKKNVLYRLKQLELSENLVGVLNERGEFTYYSPQEMSKIAQFIKDNGHVTNKDLVECIGKLIQVQGL